MEEQGERGILFVVSGPSGAGKSTVISEMLQETDNLYFSVSFTTRSPRPGEKDGVNYNFVDRAEFERMIRDGELLEYAEYVGNYYGTSMRLIEEHLDSGEDVLLDIEVQGAAIVREKRPDSVFIFITAPSFEELEQRLRGRGTNDDRDISKRLKQAKKECREATKYKYVIVNHSVPQAVMDLETVIRSERRKAGREPEKPEEIGNDSENNIEKETISHDDEPTHE